MKKLMAILLTISLMFSMFAPQVLALNIFQATSLSLMTQVNNIATQTSESKVSTSQEYVPTGNLEFDVRFALPMSNVEHPNLNVILKDSSDHSYLINLNNYPTMERVSYTLGTQKGEVSIRKMDYNGKAMNGVDGANIKYYAITVYNLRKGTYSLTLSGSGYKDYTVNNITLDDYAKRVSISNEKGMFEVGDVNNDNKVDASDIDELIKHIDSTDANDLNNYDLDRNGYINIADMAMIASVINGKTEKVTIEDTAAIISKDSFSVDKESTTVDGDITNLFQPDGTVGVHPANPETDITSENPAVISLDMKKAVEMSEIRIEVGTENVPEEMDVMVEYEDGSKENFPVGYELNEDVHTFTDKASAGTIAIDLKGQKAVKKVTIKITKTSSKNLAEIAEVEFLNNVKEDVLPPDIGKPTNLNVVLGSEMVTVNYNYVANATGYEILFETLDASGNPTKTEILQTTYNTYDIMDLKNYKDYRVSVRAVNGDWKGPYSNSTVVSPIPTRKPPKVDMVNVKPVGNGFDISWKDMDDTQSYNLYYRQKGDDDYQKIGPISKNSYQLRNLKEGTDYEIYITGNNHLGEGSASELSVGTTIAKGAVITPRYNLINRHVNDSEVTDHIKDVVFKTGTMSNDSKYAMVDDDPDTYWDYSNWQVSASAGFDLNAPVFVLDKAYEMNRFVLTVPDSYTQNLKPGNYDPQNNDYNDVLVHYWNGVETRSKDNKTTVHGVLTKVNDINNRQYYLLKLEKPITADAVQFGLTVVGNGRSIQISEAKFYEYAKIESEIENLFTDELHLVLADGVDRDKITSLQKALDEVDSVSGEKHPDYEALKLELDYALQILDDKDLHKDIVTVKQNITSRKHQGFSALSELQPLGVAAKAGETIIVYVGTKGNVLPEIIFSQYYAEAGTWKQSKGTLKKGANVITVPKIGSYADEISGGPIYIRYPNANPSSYDIKVRVSGGTKIPTLDLYDNLDNKIVAITLITAYLQDLKAYVDMLKKEEGFNEQLNVLNTTEIGTLNGLFSVSATKTLAGITTGLTSETDQVNRIYNSLVAFEEMVNLFYNHKGLSRTPEDKTDTAPYSRINIRTMRMFDGAFMYASGDHIGIEHGSVPGLMQAMPNQGTGNDMTTTGYFGWGISHEIGHQINQGNLAHAEVTNNVFALLAQTSDDKAHARIEDRYDKIYKKVTSNTFGKGTDVFVTLAMYWQLHLAYDYAKNTTTFNDTNSIFARINKESRRVSADAALKDLTKDELLVVLASKAAGKDLTEHFTKWGIVVTDKVKEYLNNLNLEKETKPIWYLNDEARRYRLNGGSAMPETTTLVANFKETDSQNKRYTLVFDAINGGDAILGYEIKRNNQVIMFTTDKEFTDMIGSLNNQALNYEVTAYDKYLNPTNTVKLPEVKVSHDGRIVKDNFDIESNYKLVDEIIDNENPDMNTDELSVNNLIDNDQKTYFNGDTRVTSKDKTNPYVIIDLNDAMDVAGLKYQAASNNDGVLENTIIDYIVSVSKDRENWTKVKEGKFDLTKDNDYINTIYFDKPNTTGGDQLWTYSEISYVKIEAVGNNGLSGAEIDIIAPPGDNVDISKETIGVLESDYSYIDGDGKEAVIPANSVVFKGDYRGNPSFNVILLVNGDNDQEVYEGENFLFAKLNDDYSVSEIAHGYWFYVLTKEQYENLRKGSVRAELYRVDDAMSNSGQRLTSTSLAIDDLPAYDSLPSMNIVDSTEGE